MAELYGIPLVFYGENQAEYGNNIEENYSPIMKAEFFMGDRDPKTIHLGGKSAEDIVKEYDIGLGELEPYFPIDNDRPKSIGTEVHYLGYYIKWDPQEIYYYVVKNTGFQPNEVRTEGSYSKYSSIDDKMDPFHYFTTYIKFGLGRASYDAAQEIRNEKITREEGVALVKKYDSEFPKKYFQECLRYMDLTETVFWKYVDESRSPHLWSYDGSAWHLRNTIWMANP